MSMDCRRAEELFSDHLEGALHPLIGAELERHLAGCESCRPLRAAFGEAVEALRTAPELDAPHGLAERIALAALRAPRVVEIRPALTLPHWLQAAAAGFALIALGTTLALVGPERGTRAAQRLVSETVIVSSSLMERKDRIVEDVRLLGVVLSTAFEGRIEKVGERVQDYKRLLERRKASPQGDPKQGRELEGGGTSAAEAFRTGTTARS
jgi:predicted anti-sigma-YlaC factor YlaD